MIQQLQQPVERDLNGIPVQCTHRAVGLRYQPWVSRAVTVDIHLGIMKDGAFKTVTADSVQLKNEDAQALRQAVGGVIADTLREAERVRQRRGTVVYMNVAGTHASTPDESITVTRQEAHEDRMVIVPNGLARNGWRRMRDNSFEEVAGS